MAGVDPRLNHKSFERHSATDPMYVDRKESVNTPAPAKLKQAEDFFRRKVDKLPTPVLRLHADGYHHADAISGERFYLTPEEVAQELARRRGVATKLAQKMYNAYAAHAEWKSIDGKLLPLWDGGDNRLPLPIVEHWIASAEVVIEDYRCLL